MNKKYVFILAVLLIFSFVLQLFSKNAPNSVEDVKVHFEDDAIVINIITDFAPDYRYFSLDVNTCTVINK